MTTNAEVQKLRAEGKFYREIADLTGISMSTVYYKLYPAKKRARDARYRERNRHKRRASAVRTNLARNNPDAEPTQARTCQCENPWHTREPVCDGSFEDWCLACSRAIR